MPREGGASSNHGLTIESGQFGDRNDGEPIVPFLPHMSNGDYWIARLRGR
jgi:hypothetical protein